MLILNIEVPLNAYSFSAKSAALATKMIDQVSPTSISAPHRRRHYLLHRGPSVREERILSIKISLSIFALSTRAKTGIRKK